MKKYYLKHKYLSAVDNGDYPFLNWDLEYKIMFLDNREETEYYITQFSDDMITMLVNDYGLNLQDWIKEEV